MSHCFNHVFVENLRESSEEGVYKVGHRHLAHSRLENDATSCVAVENELGILMVTHDNVTIIRGRGRQLDLGHP